MFLDFNKPEAGIAHTEESKKGGSAPPRDFLKENGGFPPLAAPNSSGVFTTESLTRKVLWTIGLSRGAYRKACHALWDRVDQQRRTKLAPIAVTLLGIFSLEPGFLFVFLRTDVRTTTTFLSSTPGPLADNRHIAAH